MQTNQVYRYADVQTELINKIKSTYNGVTVNHESSISYSSSDECVRKGKWKDLVSGSKKYTYLSGTFNNDQLLRYEDIKICNCHSGNSCSCQSGQCHSCSCNSGQSSGTGTGTGTGTVTNTPSQTPSATPSASGGNFSLSRCASVNGSISNKSFFCEKYGSCANYSSCGGFTICYGYYDGTTACNTNTGTGGGTCSVWSWSDAGIQGAGVALGISHNYEDWF